MPFPCSFPRPCAYTRFSPANLCHRASSLCICACVLLVQHHVCSVSTFEHDLNVERWTHCRRLCSNTASQAEKIARKGFCDASLDLGRIAATVLRYVPFMSKLYLWVFAVMNATKLVRCFGTTPSGFDGCTLEFGALLLSEIPCGVER